MCSVLGLFGYELCKFKDGIDESYGSLRMMLNLGLRYKKYIVAWPGWKPPSSSIGVDSWDGRSFGGKCV